MIPRQPFHAEGLLDFLRPRCVPGVEEVVGTTYRRAVAGDVIEIDLRPEEIRGDERLARCVADVDADPVAVDARLDEVAPLAALVREAPGLRVPGTADPAELAVRAVLGQQVSVAAARTVAGRLAAALGEPVRRPAGGVTRSFPASAALAEIEPAGLPMPRARARCVVSLARALAGGMPVERRALLEIPGIGPWTADYVALRTGDPDVLLDSDLGVRHALGRLGAADARRLAEACRPYGSYATVHLWRWLAATS